jgi:Cu+-exporting ATPase
MKEKDPVCGMLVEPGRAAGSIVQYGKDYFFCSQLFLAFIYNALSVPLAAFGLVTPMLASAAMSASSVS